MAVEAAGSDDREGGGIEVCAPLRAEADGYLAEDVFNQRLRAAVAASF